MKTETTGHGGAREGAGRDPLPVREKRRNRVMVNLTDDEYREVTARAKRIGRTIPQLMLGCTLTSKVGK